MSDDNGFVERPALAPRHLRGGGHAMNLWPVLAALFNVLVYGLLILWLGA